MIQKVVTINAENYTDPYTEGGYTHSAGISKEDVDPEESKDESDILQGEFETFLGVALPVSKIQEYITANLNDCIEDIYNFPVWDVVDGIMDILKKENCSTEGNFKFEVVKTLISSTIREYSRLNVLDESTFLGIQSVEKRIDSVFFMEKKYNNSNLSFYADPICFQEGREIWPIVSTNEEGFHYCIGLVIKENGKYIAIPFIKEVPHVSTLKMIREAVENTHDSMIHNYPTELWSSLCQRDGMAKRNNELPINALTVKYLSASKIGELIQNIFEENYDLSGMNGYSGPAPFISEFAKSMFITEEMDIDKMSYAAMYKTLEYRTLNLNPDDLNDFEDRVKVNFALKRKQYTDFNLAMIDILNINQIGLKKSQNEETKNFLSDFLSF